MILDGTAGEGDTIVVTAGTDDGPLAISVTPG